jgi:hypothetical protein
MFVLSSRTYRCPWDVQSALLTEAAHISPHYDVGVRNVCVQVCGEQTEEIVYVQVRQYLSNHIIVSMYADAWSTL